MTEHQTRELTRREFTKLAAVLGLGLAGLTWLREQFVVYEGLAEAAEDHNGEGPHWIMVIDLETCIGCERCVHACQAANNTTDGNLWNILLVVEESFGKPVFMTRPCMHCEHAPCVEVCPVVATYNREKDGLVMMDYDRCIGCRYCMVACPYGVRVFNWVYNTYQDDPTQNPSVPLWGTPDIENLRKDRLDPAYIEQYLSPEEIEYLDDPDKLHIWRPRGVAEKCTFCYHRLDRLDVYPELRPGVDVTVTPACCVVCPTEARVFGDMKDPNSPASQKMAGRQAIVLREHLDTKPRVYYLLPLLS